MDRFDVHRFAGRTNENFPEISPCRPSRILTASSGGTKKPRTEWGGITLMEPSTPGVAGKFNPQPRKPGRGRSARNHATGRQKQLHQQAETPGEPYRKRLRKEGRRKKRSQGTGLADRQQADRRRKEKTRGRAGLSFRPVAFASWPLSAPASRAGRTRRGGEPFSPTAWSSAGSWPTPAARFPPSRSTARFTRCSGRPATAPGARRRRRASCLQ